GQDVVDGAEVDVPGDRPSIRPLEVDLGDAVVLEDGDALLADVDRDEELALRRRERRPARRDAATRGRARSARLLALRPLLLLLGLLGVSLRLLLLASEPGQSVSPLYGRAATSPPERGRPSRC